MATLTAPDHVHRHVAAPVLLPKSDRALGERRCRPDGSWSDERQGRLAPEPVSEVAVRIQSFTVRSLAYQLASSSVTVGAFLASVLRQSKRLRFWSWPITTIGARPRSLAVCAIHA